METVEAINLFDEYNKLKAENNRLREENYDLTLTFLLSEGKAATEIKRMREPLELVVVYWDEWMGKDGDPLALSLEEVVAAAREALKEPE
jgi:hypothetical protein